MCSPVRDTDSNPYYVGLESGPPCTHGGQNIHLPEVLQDGAGIVLLDAFGHHVQDVVHNGCPQLQVKVQTLPESLVHNQEPRTWHLAIITAMHCKHGPEHNISYC